ncbi:G-protein coupled receptor GRL101-like [Lineus longissimus]|uniref:G-protein coupled receptor GRL101-like n=1 Tax=Lineus longissimus TaxID=88925 RepID=UPI00315D2FE9
MIPLGTFRYTSKVQHLHLTGNTLGDFTGKEDFKDLPELKELRSNHFRFGCMAPQVPEENCFPKMDPCSSCTDLIRIGALWIFLWILGTIAVGGNILVLLLRILTKEPTTANTTIITSLAVSDLLMGVYLYIIAAADTTFRGYYIEVDWTWRKGIGSGAPFCVDYLRHSYYSRSGVCLSLHLTSEPAPGWEYSVAIFLGLNLDAFMIIAVLYTWMYVIIKRSVDMMKHKTSRKKGENKELVVARKMALIILTDFACWMPIIILGLAAISGKVTIPGDVYAWIAVFVLPINSAMNPILYTLSSLDLIKLICGKKEPQLDYSGSTRTNVSTPPLMHSSALCIAGYDIRAARTASCVLSVVSLQQP